jgi:hypothetical protein
MTKDETDGVDLVRESSGTSSKTNIRLEAKQSLALGDRVRMSALGASAAPQIWRSSRSYRRTRVPEQLAGQVR